MAKIQRQELTDAGDGNLFRGFPDSLMIGISSCIIAVGCTVGTLLMGYLECCLFSLVSGIALPLGAIAVLLGSFQKPNRKRPRLWQNIAVLGGIVVLGYMLTIGPANPIGLLNLRVWARVAWTGGQNELQSWAVDVLSQPRDEENISVSEDDTPIQWAVPASLWSKQVRRLRPKRVFIERLFEGGQEGVRLGFGGGFLHWYMAIGPLGSVVDTDSSEASSDSSWFRWADGIYCCFVG